MPLVVSGDDMKWLLVLSSTANSCTRGFDPDGWRLLAKSDIVQFLRKPGCAALRDAPASQRRWRIYFRMSIDYFKQGDSVFWRWQSEGG